MDGNFRGMSVLGYVGERFLEDTVYVFADAARHVAALEFQLRPDGNASAVLVVAQKTLHRVLESKIVEQRGADAGGDFVDGVEQPFRSLQGAADEVVLLLTLAGPGGPLQIERHGGDDLPHFVMQVAGNAAALLLL